ncbi:DUF6377 domain-containing protein [uncultured Alistipes sp.]|uniref:DUF6377 domain-containing protein n=1 Tax=uncultured Alistipes sp. TaxID=538949 RepID=UPI002582842C|nr:DUF6377 domain-containing protein [uncultured Alistipes sp.]
MKILPTFIVLFSALWTAPVSGNEKAELQALFRQLDHVIARSGEFTARREARIDSLKRELSRDGLSLRTRFDLTEQLAENYGSYQSDFTLLYLRRSLALAEEIGDNDLIMRTRSAIALCYSLSGRFYEAEEILGGIRDTVHVSRRTLLAYYVAQHRKNRELCYLTEPGDRRDVYRRREHYYAVNAAKVSDDVYTGLYYGYMDAILREDWSEASILCDSLLASVPSDSHAYAKAANHKALLEGKAGHADRELAWFVRSALADIQSAVRDHGSLCAVSEELFNRGDVDRAMNYIRVAISDTRFFNSPSRSWRDMAILPQIEAAYSERNARLHTMYIVLIVVVLLFFISAAAAVFYVLSQNRRLYAVQQTLRMSNDKLNELARSLRETNGRLSSQNIRIADANRIKEVYIGGFLQTISEYINKLSATYQYVNKMLRDDRIAELRREYARSNVRNDELKEFYTLFDETFLGLFPSFIDEMNGLLTEEARTEGRHDGELTTVLRIYALIRLGITDTATIAALLHCSIRTVYNYRSVTQRHARPGIGDFEQRVQLIGLNGTTDNTTQNLTI